MNRGKMIKRTTCIMLILGMIVSCRMPMGSEAKTVLKKTSITSAKETSNATVTIKWKKVASAKGYIIYRKKSVAGNFKKIATIKKNKTTSYVDKKTEDGTIYYYSIKTYKGKKKSAYCTQKKVTTSKPEIGTLTSSSIGVSSDKPGKVTFEVQVKNTNRIKKDSLALYENGSLKGYLVDGGSDGKDKLNDGYYSSSISISGQPGTKYTYYVKYKKTQTNEETVTIYEPVTSENLSLITDSNKAISGIVDDKKSDKENLDAVYGLAKQMEASGKLSSVSMTYDNVSMVFPNGIRYIYSLRDENLNSGDGKVSISTYQPYYHTGDINKIFDDNTLPDESARKVVDLLPNCSFDRNYDSTDVDLDRINEFGENQFIIWDGHGGYADEIGSYLSTGISVTHNSALDWDEFISGKLVLSYGMDVENPDENTIGRLGVTGKYFQDHLGDMNNTFIFFTSCHTSQKLSDGEYDDRFLGVFTRKGASAIAFSDSVYSAYTNKLLEAWISEMLTINQNSKMYNTAYEALTSAINSVGSDDSVITSELSDTHPAHAFPVLWGDSDYRFSNECQANLKLDCTEKTLDADESFTLTAETEADGKYLKWTVDGPNAVSVTGTGKSLTVTGKNAGEATITCSIGNKSASCKITVSGMRFLEKSDLKNNYYILNYAQNQGRLKIDGSYLYAYKTSLTYYKNGKWITAFDVDDYKMALKKGCKICMDYNTSGEGKPDIHYYDVKTFNEMFFEKKYGWGMGIRIGVKKGKISDITVFS